MRIAWVDNAKALGIIAIVVGHDPGLPLSVRDFLYTFHVPVFFFMSGFLVKPTQLQTPFGAYARRMARRLLIPYAFFWGLSFLLWCAFQAVAGKPPWVQTDVALLHLEGFALATSAGLEAVNGPLWFYTSLFTTVLLCHWLARPRMRFWLPLCLVLLASLQAAVTHALAGERLFWNLDLLCVAALFYTAGHLARRELERKGGPDASTGPPARLPAFGLTLVAFSATAGVTHLNGKVDMSWQFFGRSYPLFVLGAFCGITLVTALARLLPESRVGRYLSDNTIVIFSVHFPMYFAFSGVATYVLGLPPELEQDGMLPPLLYPTLALLLCVPTTAIIRRFMPWGLGR